MSVVKISFEADNFNKTIQYVKEYLKDELVVANVLELESYFRKEIEKLIKGDMKQWREKGYNYFERLVHHPVQGVTCLYIIGEEPKNSIHSFEVDIENKKFTGNIVACLYTYLI